MDPLLPDPLFPPFEPDRPDVRRRRFRPLPFRYLFPNLVTIVSLCAGLTAVRVAIEGRLDLAIYAIAFAAFLDGVDGRIARLMKGTSRFGAELDSLADFVNFGCAPALILYVWGLRELGAVGWVCCLIFAVAMALRLARFNVSLDEPQTEEWRKSFAVGVPAPAGAMCGLLPIYLSLVGLVSHGAVLHAVAAGYLVLVAMLMVSRVPTFSGKTMTRRVPREAVLPVFLGVVLAVTMLASQPVETIAALTVLYLGSIAFSVRRFRRLAAAVPQKEGE